MLSLKLQIKDYLWLTEITFKFSNKSHYLLRTTKSIDFKMLKGYKET